MAGISVSHPVMISTIIKWVWLLQVCSVTSTVSIWVVRWCFRLIQVIISPSVVMLLHWRMPWNMISAVAILMLCNGIRISLKSKKNTINEIGCVMEFMTHLFRFFIFSFLHFFVSSFFRFFIFFIGFHGWIGGILAYRITHGFSLIFGRWPMAGARRIPLLFCVTQIPQITQIFLRGSFLSHRFHRLHRFFMESLANRFFQSQGYLHRPNRSPLRQSVSNRCSKNPPNKIRVIRWIK